MLDYSIHVSTSSKLDDHVSNVCATFQPLYLDLNFCDLVQPRYIVCQEAGQTIHGIRPGRPADRSGSVSPTGRPAGADGRNSAAIYLGADESNCPALSGRVRRADASDVTGHRSPVRTRSAHGARPSQGDRDSRGRPAVAAARGGQGGGPEMAASHRRRSNQCWTKHAGIER